MGNLDMITERREGLIMGRRNTIPNTYSACGVLSLISLPLFLLLVAWFWQGTPSRENPVGNDIMAQM